MTTSHRLWTARCSLFAFVTLCLVGCATVAVAASPAASGKDQTQVPPVDIRDFAKVVTSDPNRMQGTTASRTGEFPAEDVHFETELKPAADGGYVVPTKADGPSCIGLLWREMRYMNRLELHWAAGTAVPAADSVKLQYWVGSSPWQGEWKPLNVKPEKSPGVWSWNITAKDQPKGTYRVRWVFPASSKPVVLKKISAYTPTPWLAADLRVELQRPIAGKQVNVVLTNGDILEAAGKETSHSCKWDASKPLELKVSYSMPWVMKIDRTVLRFELPGRPISVAVEDVVQYGCVYVPSAGLFVTLEPSRMTLPEYLQEIKGKKTVLEEVRSLPDQTFGQAMAVLHNPKQDTNPTLLSLACDNRKYVVNRDGAIDFCTGNGPDGEYPWMAGPLYRWVKKKDDYHRMVPKFGRGENKHFERHLDGQWLPMPVLTVYEEGIKYSQRTYVAPVDRQAPAGAAPWLRDRALCVAEYTIKNAQITPARPSMGVTFFVDEKDNRRVVLKPVKEGFLAVHNDRVFALIETDQASPLKVETKNEAGEVRLTGELPAGGTARMFVYLPAWKLAPADYAVLLGGTKWAERIKPYWDTILAPAMKIDIPDPLLANVIRASQVHCMLAARCEDRGRRVAPWIGSVLYGPLESEAQAVLRGMDMTGCSDFVRRGFEFFLHRYDDEGLLTTGYTMVGTGENVWTIAEHQARCNDREWFEKIAPTMVRACKWIIAQRAKTRGVDAEGNELPESGLMPPGVTADWSRYAYRLYNDSSTTSP